MTLSQLALTIAASHLEVRETAPNSGPEVDDYLRSVGLPPGNPWCAAFMFWCFAKAAGQLGLVNPCPKTGSTLRLWTLSEPYCRDSDPTPGAVYVIRHSETTGHVGIIETVGNLGVTEISGNTNRAGSREGDSVWRHEGASPEVIHGGELLGYLVFDRAAQPPDVS